MDFRRWRLLAPWLREMRHVWLGLVMVVAAGVITLRPGTSEPLIRWTGLALQLLGILTVAWGISETRALFGHPSLASKAREWVERFPLRTAQDNSGMVAITTSSARVSGRLSQSIPADPNAPLADRVATAERNIVLINERIGHGEQENDKRFAESKRALDLEALLRDDEDRKIRERLEATGTGGVHISAIGATWLFFGSILSTCAPEIEKWLK